jgi:1-acyl-sn-glycerol-3-phosphate acyltransferase
MAIDGTQNCLPAKSWKFGTAKDIKLKVLDPIDTQHLSGDDINKLTDEVRLKILSQLAEWRKKPVNQIDGLVK